MFGIGYDDSLEMQLFIDFVILYSSPSCNDRKPNSCHEHLFTEVEITRDTDSD